jgi:hypothetical protein
MNLSDCIISRLEFDNHLKKCADMAMDHLHDKRESLVPQLLIVGKDMDGEIHLTVCMLAVGFNEDKEKRDALFQVGWKFYENEEVPLAVFLTAEAWLSHERKPHVEPRHDPDKKEVIVIFGLSLNGDHQRMVHIPVRRQNGKMVGGELQSYGEDDKVQCLLLGHFYRGFMEHFKEAFGKIATEP